MLRCCAQEQWLALSMNTSHRQKPKRKTNTAKALIGSHFLFREEADKTYSPKLIRETIYIEIVLAFICIACGVVGVISSLWIWNNSLILDSLIATTVIVLVALIVSMALFYWGYSFASNSYTLTECYPVYRKLLEDEGHYDK